VRQGGDQPSLYYDARSTSHQDVGAFNVNFNTNLKLFLRLSNCASVDEKKTLIILALIVIFVGNCDVRYTVMLFS
jgi:hypothetical protein